VPERESYAGLLRYVPTTRMSDNYDLTRMLALMEYLGDPQEQFRVFHVAGTSGKTSTCYMLRDLCVQADVEVGLTVSPHMTSINERIQLGARPVSDAKFDGLVAEFLPLVERSALSPTYFEVLIALAYWSFAREQVSHAIIETGLGGLLDGTNVVRRADKLCVISDVGLDHTEILGNTIEDIAAQKAGIIQPGNHVVVQRQDAAALDVITAYAEAQSATLEVADQPVRADGSVPPFQARNWRLATAAFRYLAEDEGLSLAPAGSALRASALPPGRMEQLELAGKTVLLDGAHNPQKLRALVESFEARGLGKVPTLANFADAPREKITAAVDELAYLTGWLVVPDFSLTQDMHRTSMPAPDLVRLAQAVGIDARAAATVEDGIASILSRPDPLVLVTGSLYLVSIARAILTSAQASE
jgi:dihydrofolate synthase / folylpolyglutamate synthase